MLCESFIEKREVGIDDVARGEVALEQFLDEETGFVDRRELERVVELVIVVESGRGGAVVDLSQVKPIVREGVDEAAGLRIVEQAVGLRAENLGTSEPVLGGQRAEFVVRRGVPQE